ncbi:hypothetical protein GGS24DRAFT_453456 [Hypoxylon argillaceum]|nr:hypothetical protein GGS24DRAFT_453456 [Hypoxylon argillaceum]
MLFGAQCLVLQIILILSCLRCLDSRIYFIVVESTIDFQTVIWNFVKNTYISHSDDKPVRYVYQSSLLSDPVVSTPMVSWRPNLPRVTHLSWTSNSR